MTGCGQDLPKNANLTFYALFSIYLTAVADKSSQHQTMVMDQNHQDTLTNETVIENDGKSKRICLVGGVAEDQDVLNIARLFNVPVVTSETGSELLDDDSLTTYFILSEFEGPVFDDINKAKTKHK